MSNLYKVLRCNIILQAFAVIIIVLSISNCGRKGPPFLPRQEAVPAVNDLESLTEGNNIILTWTFPGNKQKKSVPVTGFVIHQAKYPLSEKICENCPVNYKPVAEVAADAKGKDGKMMYSQQLDKGFKYFFKVTAYTKNMASESRDSNIIKFDH